MAIIAPARLKLASLRESQRAYRLMDLRVRLVAATSADGASAESKAPRAARRCSCDRRRIFVNQLAVEVVDIQTANFLSVAITTLRRRLLDGPPRSRILGEHQRLAPGWSFNDRQDAHAGRMNPEATLALWVVGVELQRIESVYSLKRVLVVAGVFVRDDDQSARKCFAEGFADNSQPLGIADLRLATPS